MLLFDGYDECYLSYDFLKFLRYFDEKDCCVVIIIWIFERDELVVYVDMCVEIIEFNIEYRMVFKIRIFGCKIDV